MQSAADPRDRVYFAAGMHVERAAERLFVHPNTLRYRIARFEELTDASLRDHRRRVRGLVGPRARGDAARRRGDRVGVTAESGSRERPEGSVARQR